MLDDSLENIDLFEQTPDFKLFLNLSLGFRKNAVLPVGLDAAGTILAPQHLESYEETAMGLNCLTVMECVHPLQIRSLGELLWPGVGPSNQIGGDE